MKINILGSYITQFGELWDADLATLIKEATAGAITDADVDDRQIDAIFVANKAAGQFEQQLHLNALVSQLFDHFPPSVRVEAACASGGVAIYSAINALLSGRSTTVMVLGVEKMTDVSASQATSILSTASDAINERGSTFPGLYALLANAYQKEYGSIRSALSAVAVKNHFHALDNPQAQFHKKITSQQVESSLLVADPLRLLDCSPISDGAAAVILTTKNVKSPHILACELAQDTLDLASRQSLTSLNATKKAVTKAYKNAEVSIKNIEAAEVHDCFTIAEILASEDLGFFTKGKGARAVISSQTAVGGKVVINPSGGLKACGHPVGATGVKQIAYLYQQLKKGRFNKVLAHNVGGSGATAVVTILEK